MKQGDLFGSSAPEPGPDRGREPERAPAPPDADARRRAVTEFERPVMLVAGAGTGKTATLVARVVQWCLGPGWDDALGDAGERAPEENAVAVLAGVSAITFTEAAAAEMSMRVGQALARIERVAGRRAAGEACEEAYPIGLVLDALPDDGVLFERARALRAALDHLNASTIHAFCRRLLAAHPLAVGMDPAFEVDATFTRAETCVREVIEAYLGEAWAEPVEPDLIALAKHGVGPPEIEKAVIDLMDAGARALDFREDPLSDEACERLVAELSLAHAGAIEPVSAFTKTRGNGPLVAAGMIETANALSVADGAAREKLAALSTSLLVIWDKPRSDKLNNWSKGKLAESERKVLSIAEPEFVERSACLRTALDPFLELDLELFDPARRVVGRLLADVEDELRRRGIATFNDLLSGAWRLLAEHPEIAARERRRLRLLLVDEFQDTDAVQCGIVAAIGLEGDAAERPSLFLVGDPKQSIFAWRNADLGAFDDFAERVDAAGGVALELSTNFRSRSAVLEEVERAVAPVMVEERGVQPAFARLEPGREDARDAAGPTIEYWASWPQDDGGFETSPTKKLGASYECEALALASDIRRRHDGDGTAWRDFAVCFRSFTDLEPYLQRLREAGVPYEVQSDRKYYQRREVIDATALVRTVADPYDPLALVTLLRSPMVGVPDAALLPLWEQQLPADVAFLRGPDEERLAKLSASVRRAAERVPEEGVPGNVEGWENSLIAALGALGRARKAFREEPADRWIDLVRSLFLPDVVESARFLGAYRVANLERFFRDLLRSLEERSGDVISVIRGLRANLAREDRSEASRPGDSGQDAVRILTIHGAKGLEFPHVYLAQTHKGTNKRGGRGDTSRFDRRTGAPAYVLFGSPSPEWFRAERRRDESEAAERVRLLYVALTRASERLVVLGSFAPDPKAKTVAQAGNIAELLAHRSGGTAVVRRLAAQAAEGNLEPCEDDTGALWRVAASIPPASGTRASGESGGTAPASAEAIEKDSRAIAADRVDAALRSRRPFSRAASDEAHADGAEHRAERRFANPAEETSPTALPSIGREAAQAAGTAVHRALELFDAGAERAAELERLEAQLAPVARSLTTEERAEDAVARARELLQRIAGNGILDKLAALGDAIVARELPVLLPIDDEVAGSESPVGFVSGAIDLVYRDPDTRELVVADYKTDAVENDAAIAERSEQYRAQGGVYTAAVQEALGLEARPRFELWFLASGLVREVRAAKA